MRKYADCERAVQETVARFGRLDILVNCAAGNFLATAEELSSNGFRTGAQSSESRLNPGLTTRGEWSGWIKVA